MKLTDEQVTEIAGNLIIGLSCYVHKQTQDVISIPNPLGMDADHEGWEEQHEELEKNGSQYEEIFPMDARTSFNVMEKFATQRVDDEAFREKLLNALQGRKPFRNFRHLIDDSDYRQDWFNYGDEQYHHYVRRFFSFDDEEE